MKPRAESDTESFCAAVAQEIRRRREEKGLSKNRLAEMAGISQPMVGLIERQVHVPTLATLHRVAVSLGTTPIRLIQTALVHERQPARPDPIVKKKREGASESATSA